MPRNASQAMAKEETIQIEDLIDNPTFIQWVNGENSPQAQEWEYRYQSSSEDRAVMDNAKLIVEGIPFNRRFISDNKVEIAWQKALNVLDLMPDSLTSKRNRFGLYWKIAAAITLLLIAGIGLYTMHQNGEEVYRTAYGQRTEVILPDGSQVTMNANSTLSFVRKNPRKVTMTGEIYFDIEKKPETGEPFLVHTPDLDIQVLGTEFNVNSRQKKTEVLLDEGSIELDLKEKGIMRMVPGDFVSYSAVENKILEQQTAEKPEVITSWKEGVLLLDSVSLVSTLSLLEDTYNITTIIENQEIGDKILVGGVPNDNLETCVKALRTIYDLDIRIAGDTLLVR